MTMPNEKRLIDQDKFQAMLNQQIEFGAPDLIAAVYAALHDSQVVDAVEVVRCRDCGWYSVGESVCTNPKCTKSWYGCRVPEQHFCSYGERRADNNA